MKKIIPLILVLALTLSMSSTVFASSITQSSSSQQGDVNAIYTPGATNTTIISVDIAWNQMNFVYHGASEPTWDASSHQYVGETEEAGWDTSGASITITNHSNAILQAGISYTAETNFDTTFMTFSDDAPYIGSAHTSDTEGGIPCSITILAIPGGTLPDSTTLKTKIGTITVKVSDSIAADTALEALRTLYETTAGRKYDASALSRGTVYFPSQTVANNVSKLVDDADSVIYDDAASDADKNTALNALIVALYSNLKIKE